MKSRDGQFGTCKNFKNIFLGQKCFKTIERSHKLFKHNPLVSISPATLFCLVCFFNGVFVTIGLSFNEDGSFFSFFSFASCWPPFLDLFVLQIFVAILSIATIVCHWKTVLLMSTTTYFDFFGHKTSRSIFYFSTCIPSPT